LVGMVRVAVGRLLPLWGVCQARWVGSARWPGLRGCWHCRMRMGGGGAASLSGWWPGGCVTIRGSPRW
jgi:hypothetical protein